MRVFILGALLIVAATAAFALGRTTAPDAVPEAPAKTNHRDIAVRLGDTFRVPSLELNCVFAVEAEVRQRFFCLHTGTRSRYQVAFERDRTFVYRIDDPSKFTVFPER